MDDVGCTGQENRLQDCKFISGGEHFDCPGHNLDISIRCKKCSNKSDAEARLVDKSGNVVAGAGIHGEKMQGIATGGTQCSPCRTCPHGQHNTGGCSGNMDTKCSKVVPVVVCHGVSFYVDTN